MGFGRCYHVARLHVGEDADHGRLFLNLALQDGVQALGRLQLGAQLCERTCPCPTVPDT
jgi:hypothetical protein